MTETYIQMLLALAAILGLMGLMTFFLRRKAVKPGLLQVMAYHSFGPRKGLAAVKVGKEVLLLGITTTDLKLLKTLSEADLQTGARGDIAGKLEHLKNLKEKLDEPV